jgi:endo-alpha-1,4-polygalactosaminidase (GH114 family)
MLDFFRRAPSLKFDRKVLRKNDISILILDERYNSLFFNNRKTAEIVRCEESLKELLKEQSRLTAELKEISQQKKHYMDMIIKLTPEVFEKNNEEAKKKMVECEKEIKRINNRTVEIERKLESIPDEIREKNLELLEYIVNMVYFKIRANQKRAEQLEGLIEETRARLREYIDEKESLSQDETDVYSYFHDLLGGEELEKLDTQFFK